ncbi:MAG: hypothetical protein WC979_09845 [Candidatus Pacearchaeota archaeon]|jgi:hypothetical protein
MVAEKDAIRRYGKDTYIKMLFFLEGVQVVNNNKGEIDIPEQDLELAYELITKGKNNKLAVKK